jgi:hypothetical protein
MTQGYLLFAHNNEQIPYGLFAVWQAHRIAKWLNKPVSIVTDHKTLDSLKGLVSVFDHVIISNDLGIQTKNYSGQQLTFNNVDRCMSYDLTPYDETMVIDTDIIIQSDRMNVVWNNIHDILVCKNSNHLFDKKFVGFDWLSNYGIKFFWATEFYFKKNKVSKIFFDRCLEIKEKYNWYAFVYDITASYIRNDHIWSIALHELGGAAGSSWATELPYNLYYSLATDNILSMDDTSVTLLGDDRLSKIKGCDLHAMNKFDLLEQVKKELGL